jgi:hypothetical protein
MMMSEIPARVAEDGSIRFGESFTVIGQRLIVSGDILIVYETRRYSGFHQETVEVGRFRLQRIA